MVFFRTRLGKIFICQKEFHFNTLIYVTFCHLQQLLASMISFKVKDESGFSIPFVLTIVSVATIVFPLVKTFSHYLEY